jgi:hypothetical protein
MSGHLEHHMRDAHRCIGPFTIAHHDEHHALPDRVETPHRHVPPLVDPSSITQLGVDLEIADGSWWPHLADSPVKSGAIDRVGVLPNSTTGGHPSVQILVTLEDGTKVVAQTTWRNFSLAMVALIARWGTP